ncbi:MAG: hypothetical protein L0Z48_12215, partial [candidate division Zixibacteria bacterium]|nr:hypothetical protein [candidate division Zixibacteria bacterium]
GNRGEGSSFISGWMGLTYGIAFLTVFVPALRGFGYGNGYLYFAAFPTALCLAAAAEKAGGTFWALGGVFLFLNLFALGVSIHRLRRHRGISLPAEVVARVRAIEGGTWMCFPYHLHEHVAYRAGKTVLWGAHGYGFQRLKPIYPVLRVSFEALQETYGLRYLLVEESCLETVNRVPVAKKEINSHGRYHIFELTGAGDMARKVLP